MQILNSFRKIMAWQENYLCLCRIKKDRVEEERLQARGPGRRVLLERLTTRLKNKDHVSCVLDAHMLQSTWLRFGRSFLWSLFHNFRATVWTLKLGLGDSFKTKNKNKDKDEGEGAQGQSTRQICNLLLWICHLPTHQLQLEFLNCCSRKHTRSAMSNQHNKFATTNQNDILIWQQQLPIQLIMAPIILQIKAKQHKPKQRNTVTKQF